MKINLPPIRQEKTYTCLPACLRIVLHYLGTSLTEEEIANECNTTEAGTTLANAIHAVHSLGFNTTRIQNATLEDLMHYLSHNKPVIVLVGVEHLPYGDFGTHAVIVCGFEGDEVLYIDTALGREVRLDVITFLKAWRSRGRIGIVVHSR
jgi:ABC-type bacteriocin/lantibiotic exporter with double-glycine peptidase domain